MNYVQIGDRVLNQKTQYFGKVVGYGHEIVNGAYMSTVIVRVAGNTSMSVKTVVEDLVVF